MSFKPQPPPPMNPGRWVKLALEGPNAEKEGPFVRVQIPEGGEVLKTLRDRALDLRKAVGSFEPNLADAKVFFTYRDPENDLCFIFSAEDLLCALPLYGAPLRVFARIEVPDVKVDVPNLSSASTQTLYQERSFSDIPVHKVVEAVVGILTAASVALQKHVRKDPPVTTSARAANSGTTATSTSRMEAPPATLPQTVPFSFGSSEPITVSGSSGASGSSAPSISRTRSNAASEPEENQESRPFIHGRHTCDGCLLTPIIGKRYHAVNLKDYDLCTACKDNYQGDEITFEAEELERDRPMQERWARRFDKWSKKVEKQQEKIAMKQAIRSGPSPANPPQPPVPPCGNPPNIPSVGSPPPCGPPPHFPHCGPPPHFHPCGPPPPHVPPFGPPTHFCGGPPPPHVPPFGPPPFGPHGPGGHHRRCGGARHWNHGRNFGQPEQSGSKSEVVDLEVVDQALKEAIRRSLADMKEAAEKNNAKNKSDERSTPTAPVEEPSVKNEEVKNAGRSARGSPTQSVKDPSVDNFADLEENVKVALKEAGRALKVVGPALKLAAFSSMREVKESAKKVEEEVKDSLKDVGPALKEALRSVRNLSTDDTRWEEYFKVSDSVSAPTSDVKAEPEEEISRDPSGRSLSEDTKRAATVEDTKRAATVVVPPQARAYPESSAPEEFEVKEAAVVHADIVKAEAKEEKIPSADKAQAIEEPEEDIIVAPDDVQADANEESKQSDEEVVKEESFSLDAEGSGDVARAVGETMDAIANVINQISAELKRGNIDDASHHSDLTFVSSPDHKEGSVILTGEEGKGDDESHNSWDVVDDDEALARAAQVIGSALFESGVGSRSSGPTHTSFSLNGSDLSTLPTVASLQPAQTACWAAQLSMLHEVGFNDDALNIDIMERLAAADIGCGETTEVSVERVVNELMRNW